MPQSKDVMVGSLAKDAYTFYVIISREDATQLEVRKRIRLGRYTALRMDEPAFQWDGKTEAIKREEYVTGTKKGQWPATEVDVLAASARPFPVANCFYSDACVQPA